MNGKITTRAVLNFDSRSDTPISSKLNMMMRNRYNVLLVEVYPISYHLSQRVTQKKNCLAPVSGSSWKWSKWTNNSFYKWFKGIRSDVTLTVFSHFRWENTGMLVAFVNDMTYRKLDAGVSQLRCRWRVLPDTPV